MTTFHGTKHDDDLNGTTGDDVFDLQKGGNDTPSAMTATTGWTPSSCTATIAPA